MSEAQDLVRLIILFFLKDKNEKILDYYNLIIESLKGKEVSNQAARELSYKISQYINFIANNFNVKAEDIINDLVSVKPEEIEINESVQ